MGAGASKKKQQQKQQQQQQNPQEENQQPQQPQREQENQSEEHQQHPRKEDRTSAAPPPRREWNPDSAATKIQSLFRGRQQRKRFRKLVVCYMCGLEYSYASLDIHQRSCPEKQEAYKRDVPEELRGSPPREPSAPKPTEDSPYEVYKAYNEEALANYRESMCTCNLCGRKFNPEPIMKHIKICKGPIKNKKQ